MAAWRRVFGYSGLAVLVLVLLAITFTIGWRPVIGPRARSVTDRRFEATPGRLARGEYLLNSVSACLGCHGDIDWKAPRLVPELLGAGHQFSDEGLDWIVAPNLTPDRETGVGAWTDDELARAIREGIGRDGRALFPMMPYESFRVMSDEDLASVIVYLRTLMPVRRVLPMTEMPFPLNRFVNTVPTPITEPVPQPDLASPVNRGRYLVAIAACADCHTPRDQQGQVLAGLEFSGGSVFDNPLGRIAASNITPDPSGIPYYTEDLFVDAMRKGMVVARPLHPQMPWLLYRNMTDEDLRGIFAFLKTLTPAKHRVDNSKPPTDCPLCGQKHGAGDENVR
ncbi:MAG TPA: c-type cytochrome [Vicinamibacterales bacterium]|nr:c-type cytochrome [Vicinamibacterales bacterium]